MIRWAIAIFMNNNALKKQIISWIATNYDNDQEILLADGLEAAFVGLGFQFNNACAVYDVEDCINALMKQGMSNIDAWEYFDVNVQGAYVGENTPIFIERFRK